MTPPPLPSCCFSTYVFFALLAQLSPESSQVPMDALTFTPELCMYGPVCVRVCVRVHSTLSFAALAHLHARTDDICEQECCHAAQHAVGNADDERADLAHDAEKDQPASACKARLTGRHVGQTDDTVVLGEGGQGE